MPIITANILSGRPDNQKRELIRSLTDAAVHALNVQPGQVRIIINEVAPEHWGVGGVSKADQEGGA
ncbi:MAG: 4-oxalocrotonate tautomerase family protein [Sphingomonadaceae bacterium]|jgi:4-oxalocrotonate tautomerase